MSRFTTHPGLLPRGDNEWELLAPDLTWEIGALGSNNTITVPAGFITDLASIPRPLWPLIPPSGHHTNASVLHDWLYRTGDHRGRRFADTQFKHAMKATGTPTLRTYTMWAAVRLFGSRAWQG